MKDARRRRQTRGGTPRIRMGETPMPRGEAFRAWPVGNLSGHEGTPNATYRVWEPNRLLTPAENVRSDGDQPREGTAPSSFAPEPPLFFCVFSTLWAKYGRTG
jgi:hypothetical protein